MTQFRQTLPEGAVTYVCKNTLMRIAAERQGWQELLPSTKVSYQLLRLLAQFAYSVSSSFMLGHIQIGLLKVSGLVIMCT